MSTESDKRPRRPAASLLGHSSAAALERALRAEVIPRLVRAHRAPAPGDSAPQGAQVGAGAGDVDRFLLELLSEQSPGRYPTVEMLLSEGADLTALCLGLFGPVANRMGTLWRDDRCDFTTVTVAMGRLHRLMRELSASFDGAPHPRGARPARALLAQPADEQHLFGLAMVAEFLRRDGWDVIGGVGAAVPDAGARVRDEWVDVVGFSIGSDDRADWLREAIRRVRAMSCNDNVRVIVGGPVFITHPQWAVQVGADGTASDAAAAVDLANGLLLAWSPGEQEPSTE